MVVRLFFLLVILLSIIVGGCSSPTLMDAIEKNGNRNTEILFQDTTDNVVLFLNEDYTGQPMLSLNTFIKENSGYKYDSGTGEYSHHIDLSNEYEIINVSLVGNSSISALWGGVFNYHNASTVGYSLKDEDGNLIYNSSVQITGTNIVYEKLPLDIYERTHSLHYKILDDKDNVIFEK